MSKEELIDKYRHLVSGMILDGLQPRQGQELSVWVRDILAKTDRVLANIAHDALGLPPTPTPPTLTERHRNGTPQPPSTSNPPTSDLLNVPLPIKKGPKP